MLWGVYDKDHMSELHVLKIRTLQNVGFILIAYARNQADPAYTRWIWLNQENLFPKESQGVTTQIKYRDKYFLIVVFTLLLDIVFATFMFYFDGGTFQWMG